MKKTIRRMEKEFVAYMQKNGFRVTRGERMKVTPEEARTFRHRCCGGVVTPKAYVAVTVYETENPEGFKAINKKFLTRELQRFGLEMDPKLPYFSDGLSAGKNFRKAKRKKFWVRRARV